VYALFEVFLAFIDCGYCARIKQNEDVRVISAAGPAEICVPLSRYLILFLAWHPEILCSRAVPGTRFASAGSFERGHLSSI